MPTIYEHTFSGNNATMWDFQQVHARRRHVVNLSTGSLNAGIVSAAYKTAYSAFYQDRARPLGERSFTVSR
jgi:hypothetical protein